MTGRVVETKTQYAEVKPCKTRAEMAKLCCEKKPELTCCQEVEPIWNGYSADEIIKHLGLKLDDQKRDKEGRYVSIQLVPRKNPCGEKVVKYDLRQKNCCEKVPHLAFDMAKTPEILPHDRSIIIVWKGGDGREVTVKTSSNATWFSDGRKTAIGHGNSIEIFAGPSFCGNTAVTVTDDCSVATLGLRSDLGQWLDRGPVCAGLTGTPEIDSGYMLTLTVGKYKQVEYIGFPYTNFWMAWGYRCGEIGRESEVCFLPPCEEKICDVIKAMRPTTAITNICLRGSYLQEYFKKFTLLPIFCEIESGVFATYHPIYLTTFNCPDQYGSAPLWTGAVARSSGKNLYEWWC